MSSINSSGKKNEDEVRRTREEYQARDAAKTKKNKKDVKSLSEAHQAEIEALKEQHSEQLKSLKEKTQDAITRRDMEYQREIAEMRKMHGEQLKRTAAEKEQRQQQVEQALKAEIERSKKTGDSQKQNLSQNFNEQMALRDQTMQEYAEKSRESQLQAIEGNKKRMNDAHEKEVKALIDERDRRQESAQLSYEQLRKGKDSTIKTMKQNQEMQTARLNQSFESATKNHLEDDRVRDELNREAFQAGLAENRERYRKAIDKEKQATEAARGSMADVVQNRLGKRIMSLEDQTQNLERARYRDQNAAKARAEHEKNEIRAAFGRNIEDYERQKRELLNASNAKTQSEIEYVNKRNEDAMYSQNRYFQEKSSMDKVRNDERFAQFQNDLETQAQNQQLNADARFDKLNNFNSLEREKMAKWYEEASAQLRQNFETTLREIRTRNQDEKNKIFAQFSSQSREVEGKWQEKLNDVALKYEKQIASLEEKHKQQLKDQARQYERVMTENDKKSRSEYETHTSQLSHRIAKTDEQHKRELDDLKAKHQETLANLLKTRQS